MFIRAAQQAERSGEHEKAFDFRRKAATVDYQQGLLQAAIDRFRDAALRFPGNARAAETHLLATFNAAALYQRQARGNDSASSPSSARKLLLQYEALLGEHLEHWPERKSADQVRVWWGRLAEAQQDRSKARQLYQGVTPNSPHAKEVYPRLGTLLQAELNASEASASSLSAARSWFAERLQEEQGTAALVAASLEFAKLAIRFSPREYAAAERVLRRALAQSSATSSDSQTLKSLLVIASAGQGNLDQARRELQEALPLTKQPLIEILAGLQSIRDEQSDEGQLKAMSLDVVRLVQTYQSELQGTDRLLVDQAVADSAEPSDALAIYRRLAAEHIDNQRIQLRLAELLSLGRDRTARSEALEQWRLIVRQSQPRSASWFRAKLGVAQAHFSMGDHQQSRELIELLMALYPDLGGAELKPLFEQLLEKTQTIP